MFIHVHVLPFTSQTANRMMELFLKLYELGHPKFQQHIVLPVLICNTPESEADEKVHIFFAMWQLHSSLTSH